MMRWCAIWLIAGVASAETAWAQAPPSVEQLAPETNPAVLAALELPRTEPKHYLTAVLALVDLGRPELAKPILEELQGLDLSDEQRAALVEEFGSYRMLKLSRAESLAPAGGEFAEACMAAAGKKVPPATTPSEEQRREAERLREIASVPADADAATLSGILADAIKHNRPWAAERAAELIGQRGDVAVLYLKGPNPAPLVEALASGNPRVRFAALRAIVSLKPSASFPGSSLVTKSLEHFATAANERRAVVAMPNDVQGTTLAGRLRGLGFAAESTNRGAPAVTLAQQSADVELVLVDMDIDRANVRDVLYALRTDPATGQTPIAIIATGRRLYDARRLADEHARVIAFPRPQSDEAVAELVERLQELAGPHALTQADRAAMAEQARTWLAERSATMDGTGR